MTRFYTLEDLSEDVNSKLGNGGSNQVADFFARVDEARRVVRRKISPPEWQRNAYIEEAIYDQVDEYAVPEDLRSTSVINIRKLSGYRNVDRMSKPLEQVYRRRFSQKRNSSKNVFSVHYTNGVKTMSLFKPKGLKEWTHKIVNKADSLMDGGLWEAGGNIVNLHSDKLKYVAGKGSIGFDVNNSSNTGWISVTLDEPCNLKDFIETGAVFTWLDLSLPTNLVSVTIDLVSEVSPARLYRMAVNRSHDDNSFTNNWNLLKFPFQSMEEIDAPNPENIIKVVFTLHTAGEAMNNCHFDNIIARKGEVYEVEYESAYMIIDPVTQGWKKKATSGNDIIVAEEDTYQILMLETTIAVMNEATNQSNYTSAYVASIKSDLQEAYVLYYREHPSEEILEQDTTWIFGNMYDGLSEAPIYEDDGAWEGDNQEDN